MPFSHLPAAIPPGTGIVPDEQNLPRAVTTYNRPSAR